MPWAAVSDEAHSDERTHEAGAEAMGLWAMARSWMAHKLSDGRIPEGTARALARSLGIRKPEAAIARLVAARRWRREGGEFVDVDYLDENPTRSVVLARRESTKQRVGRWRPKRASNETEAKIPASTGKEVSGCNGVTNGVSNAPVTPSVTALSPTHTPSPDRSLPSVESSGSQKDFSLRSKSRRVPSDPTPAPAPAADAREQEQAPSTHKAPPMADVRRVFDAWQRLHSNGRAKLDEKRTARIRARLAQGFTVEDLERALKGATYDDWIMGRDEKSTRQYRELESILRDASKVERLIGLWQEREGGGADTPEARASSSKQAELIELADRLNAKRRERNAALGPNLPPPAHAPPGPLAAPPSPFPARPRPPTLLEYAEAQAAQWRSLEAAQ